MPSLMDIPGLGGALQARQMNQQGALSELQQAQGLMDRLALLFGHWRGRRDGSGWGGVFGVAKLESRQVPQPVHAVCGDVPDLIPAVPAPAGRPDQVLVGVGVA